MDAFEGIPAQAAGFAVDIPGGAAPVDSMDLALQWIGFENVAVRNRLREEGLGAPVPCARRRGRGEEVGFVSVTRRPHASP